MDNIPAYINRKHGEEPVDYLHPLLEPILKETYGVIIYQEQVIQIAQAMAGYTLGQADVLRRAMGKKDKLGMARQQAEFVAGAINNGVERADASYVFRLVDKFAGYGFNKSHAAAYALVSYQTAYMKANFREEFLAASMTLEMGNTDKLALFASEARRSGIEVKPPCVNSSDVDFLAELSAAPDKPGAIRYSLAALKNIGTAAVSTIVAERSAHGSYASLDEFASRVSPKALNKRALETLAAAGAFDAIEANRALVYTNVDQLLSEAGQIAEDEDIGQGSMLGAMSAPSSDSAGSSKALLKLRPAQAWTPMERLSQEFDAIGFYLSGHPLDQYVAVLKKLGAKSYAEFEAMTERGAAEGRLAGIVVSARERKSQRGNKFAFGLFSDTTGQFEAVIFSDTLAQCRDLLEPGTPVLLAVNAERDGDTVKLRVDGMEALDKAAAGVQRGLKVILDRRFVQSNAASMAALKSHLKPGGKGEIRLVLALEDRGTEMEFVVPGHFDVSPSRAGELATVPGVVEVLEI